MFLSFCNLCITKNIHNIGSLLRVYANFVYDYAFWLSKIAEDYFPDAKDIVCIRGIKKKPYI
ncbi:hypothetical protein CV643_05535 [Borreliella burgdorferi]|nr:hypothetical protein CV690_05540 [Borreliella burgdorferi]PRR21067.1 hypothetical protein CV643_05535 [Borreliella burgdorferi]